MRLVGSSVITGVAIAILLVAAEFPRTLGIPAAPFSQPATQATGATTTFQPNPSAEEILEDMNTAVRVVNAYWAQHWSDFFTETYLPPKVVGLYDGSAPGAPTCAGETLESGNAYYCKAGHFVAWDLGLMSQGLVYGDGWVYLAVAHEWGHAIQAQLSTKLRSVGTELQADCLAGAALYGAARDGSLKFEAGDAEEIAKGLAALADDLPWTRAGDHGNAAQRIRSFAAGSSGSVPACLPTSRR